MASTGVTAGYQRRRFTGVVFNNITPPPVAGYLAWWDATQINGVSDGALLTTWPDASTNHNDLSQATTANKPTYRKSHINSLPSVDTTATARFMATANITLAQPFTVFMVAADAGAGSNGEYWAAGSTTPNMQVRGGDTVWAIYAGGPGVIQGGTVTTAATLICGVYNGDSSILRQDRTQIAVGGGGNPGSGGFSAAPFTLGTSAINSPSAYYGELIVYPSALSGANITSVENYLKAKWGTP